MPVSLNESFFNVLTLREVGKGSTKVFVLDFTPESPSMALLEHYNEACNKETDPYKKSFNEFLKECFPDLAADDQVVAEFRGHFFPSDSSSKHQPFKYQPFQAGFCNGNFEGSNFIDVDFEGGSFEGVSLRGAYLKNVTFSNTLLKNLDLRHADLTEVIFHGYEDARAFEGIKFSFANPLEMQKKGLFSAQDKQLAAEIMLDMEAKQAQKLASTLKEAKDNLASQKADMPRLARAALWLQGKDPLKESLEALQAEYHAVLTAEFAETTKQRILKEASFQFTAFSDPYLPMNASSKEAAKPLRIIKATRDDVEAYLTSDQKQSFHDYMLDNFGKTDPKLRYGISLENQDLSGLDFDRRDPRADFSYCNFANANLSNTSWVNTKLQGACFEGAEIGGANFKNANLIESSFLNAKASLPASFEGAHLQRALMAIGSFAQSKFTKAKMEAANGVNTDFSGATMDHATLDSMRLRGANFRHSSMRHSSMRQADLTNACLANADMEEAQLSNAILVRAQLVEANLKKAVMEDVQAIQANFQNAIMKEVEAKGGNFTEADFYRVQAQYANFKGCIMEKIDASCADFTGATLHDAKAAQSKWMGTTLDSIEAENIDLQEAVITAASARAANMKKAILRKADLSATNLKEAILTEADLSFSQCVKTVFEEATLRNANIQNANLKAADLKDAELEGAKFNEGTYLIGANLAGAKHADALRELQLQQEKEKSFYERPSRYGPPASRADRERRLACQRAGIQALNLVVATGTYAGLGILPALIAGSTVGAAGDFAVLTASEEFGYINNRLGDVLADIGAISLAAGGGAINVGAASAIVHAVVPPLWGIASATVPLSAFIGAAMKGQDAYLRLYGEKTDAYGRPAVKPETIYAETMENIAWLKKLGKWQSYVGAILGATVGAALAISFTTAMATPLALVSPILLACTAAGAAAGFFAPEILQSAQSFFQSNGQKLSQFNGKEFVASSWQKLRSLSKEQIFDFAVDQGKRLMQAIMPGIRGVQLGSIVGVIFGISALAFGGIPAAPILTMASEVMATIASAAIDTAILGGIIGAYLGYKKAPNSIVKQTIDASPMENVPHQEAEIKEQQAAATPSSTTPTAHPDSMHSIAHPEPSKSSTI